MKKSYKKSYKKSILSTSAILGKKLRTRAQALDDDTIKDKAMGLTFPNPE